MLYVLPPQGDAPVEPDSLLRSRGEAIVLGDRLGSLRLVESGAKGVDPAVAEPGLAVRFRAGGEAIRIADDGATRKLKKLLQERQVLPWMRDRIPLLFAGDDLVAVGDLWVSADHASRDGLSVEWREKPALT